MESFVERFSAGFFFVLELIRFRIKRGEPYQKSRRFFYIFRRVVKDKMQKESKRKVIQRSSEGQKATGVTMIRFDSIGVADY